MNYLRIGTDYFKLVDKPGLNGDTQRALLKWKRATIVEDHGRDYLNTIPKYEGFTVQPSHSNYQYSVHNFYNKYAPLSHVVGSQYDRNRLEHTLKFLNHIFGEQINIGLDYLSILWKYPTQILPILCLVSEERNTGKTTFLNWLKMIFQDNMTLNKNEDFRSRFNADWSEKLIIGVDEVLLDRREDSERIKNLSTAQTYKTELKGKDREESYFFGKFILCSNNENNFILIDEYEIRYWVRKVPIIDSLDPGFIDHLKEELPEFINFIANRKISTPKKSRMWFSKEQIRTEALKALIHGTKYHLEKELLLILDDMFEDFEVDEICLANKDIIALFKDQQMRVSRSQITRVVVDKWKLETRNSSYKHYYRAIDHLTGQWITSSNSNKGRHFTFTKKFIKSMLQC